MKTLAVLATLALGMLLAGPAQPGELTPVASGSWSHLVNVPNPAGPEVMTASVAAAIQQPPAKTLPKDVNLTINVNKDGVTRAWYLSPVWMAIGGLGLILGIMLVIMAARGGGTATTVVRG